MAKLPVDDDLSSISDHVNSVLRDVRRKIGGRRLRTVRIMTSIDLNGHVPLSKKKELRGVMVIPLTSFDKAETLIAYDAS
jgi:hypothetical protein